MNRRHLVTIAFITIALVGTAACGDSSTKQSSPVTVFNVAADPAVSPPSTAAGHPITLTRTQVRSALQDLLSTHATLVAGLMHEVGNGNDHPTAAVGSLVENTRSLSNAIAVIYGAAGARAFAQLWEQHTQFFVDYARADRTHDRSAKTLARRRLLDYQSDFASFVSTATAGGAGLVAVTNLLHTHVQDLTDYIDADTSGRSDTARTILEQAVAHMKIIANAVADAIAAQHLSTVTP